MSGLFVDSGKRRGGGGPAYVRADRLGEGDRIVLEAMGREPVRISRIQKDAPEASDFAAVSRRVRVWFDVAPHAPPLELRAGELVELVEMGRGA